MDSNNFIIFATVDVIQAKKYFDLKFDHRFIILNIPFDKMNNYYNLADFAILLREDKLLNYVASPTKFGEYCLTGLPVIMNDTIEQSSQYSKELGNYVNWNDFKFNKFNVDQRIEISYKAKFYFSRKELNKQYIELYQSLI